MLPGNQAYPRRETTARRECFPIADLGDQGGGDDRTDARDFLKPPALFTRSMPGVDALLDSTDLCRDTYVLASKNLEAKPCGRRNAIILLVCNNLQ